MVIHSLVYTISAVKRFLGTLYFWIAGKPVPYPAGLALVSMWHRILHDLKILSLKHDTFDHLNPFLPFPESGIHQSVLSMYVFSTFLIPCGMSLRASGVCLPMSEFLGIMLPRSMFPCLVIMKNVAVNMGVHLSFWRSVFLFSKEILSKANTGSCGSCFNFFPEHP